jgi:hypothetical protein
MHSTVFGRRVSTSDFGFNQRVVKFAIYAVFSPKSVHVASKKGSPFLDTRRRPYSPRDFKARDLGFEITPMPGSVRNKEGSFDETDVIQSMDVVQEILNNFSGLCLIVSSVPCIAFVSSNEISHYQTRCGHQYEGCFFH